MARTEEVRQRNIASVLELMQDGRPWEKGGLSERTGISAAALTGILQDLCATGEVLFVGTAPSRGGRRAKEYQLNPNFAHLACITLGARDEGAVLTCETRDLAGNLLSREERPSGSLGAAEVAAAAARAKGEDPLVSLACVSHPGVSVGGRIRLSDIPTLRGADLAAEVTATAGIPCVVENDVNVAVIGLSDRLGAQSLALLYQPARYYVGCGLVIDHHLYNGANHAAGELRFLPFYTHAQQDEELHRDPARLLAQQLATVVCVMDPGTVGVCSDAIAHLDARLLLEFVPEGLEPNIVLVDSLDEEIGRGLAAIGRRVLRENRR